MHAGVFQANKFWIKLKCCIIIVVVLKTEIKETRTHFLRSFRVLRGYRVLIEFSRALRDFNGYAWRV